jgi:hypothetical protein
MRTHTYKHMRKYMPKYMYKYMFFCYRAYVQLLF